MSLRGLFIGIDHFQSDQVKWLYSACRDARALHALFTDTFGSGCELLTDQDATRFAIKARFAELAACHHDDIVIVAYSGHGSTSHELLTYDANPSDLPNTAIPLATLAEWFYLIPARLVVCILDCCFSGGVGAKVFVTDATSRSIDSADSLLGQISGKGRMVLTASADNEEAWETMRYRHGLLTYHLVKALQGAEEVVDGGKIAVYRLLEYVTRMVISDAATIGKEQHPTLRGQLDGDLTWPVFTAGPAYLAAFPSRCTQPATADIMSLQPYGFPPGFLAAWAGAIPSLNRLQLDAINQFGLLRGEHLVVSAPTSSGKTMVGELAALRGVFDRKRACFLLPLKSLVNDKHRYFSRIYNAFGIRVIRATGDMSDDIPALMRGQYDVCLLTYEKFASLVSAAPHVLEQLGTVIIDEVQMLADTLRGANLEFLLTLLLMKRKAGIEPQLIALSAVIGDTNGLERWLGARLLRRTERPVPLDEGILLTDGRFRYIDSAGVERTIGPIIRPELRKNSSQDLIIPLVRTLVAEGKQVIVFRETKGEARGCAGYLARELDLPPAQAALNALPQTEPSVGSVALRKALFGGVAFHTADLDRDERLVIEEQFRIPNTTLLVIAATTTLAMGVNTPAEAVIIAGLMHPSDKPYSIAEYKNIVGRAGRLGFSDRGTSYLLAMDSREEYNNWSRYVAGIPEDLQSRFIDADTDPRTLVLRAFVVARKASVKGIPTTDVINFLESSFGAFQMRQATAQWSWNRQDLSSAFEDLELHRLIESSDGDRYHLSELGRFAGESGVQVESIIRLVAVFSTMSVAAVTDPVLIAAAQLTVELDESRFPLNRSSKHKEPQTWFGMLGSQGIPSAVINSLRRYVKDEVSATLRAKKTAACLFWISPMPMSEIEESLTQHGRASDGAAGPVRTVSSRTCDLLPTVAFVAKFLQPGLDLADRVSKLLVRLELGIPAGVVAVARHAGNRLSRRDYQLLSKAGLTTREAIEDASEAVILACVGDTKEKASYVRDAAAALRGEPIPSPAPVLPEYEG